MLSFDNGVITGRQVDSYTYDTSVVSFDQQIIHDFGYGSAFGIGNILISFEHMAGSSPFHIPGFICYNMSKGLIGEWYTYEPEYSQFLLHKTMIGGNKWP